MGSWMVLEHGTPEGESRIVEEDGQGRRVRDALKGDLGVHALAFDRTGHPVVELR